MTEVSIVGTKHERQIDEGGEVEKSRRPIDDRRLVCVCVSFYYTPFSSKARGVRYLLQRLWYV